MWSENSCGRLCIQVWGKTMLIGSGSDSTPLACLCMYRKEMWICVSGSSVFVCVYFLLLNTRFYFWLLLSFCRPCLDTEFMYWGQHSNMTTKSLKKHLPPSSHQHLSFIFHVFFFFLLSLLTAWSLASPAWYGTHTVFLWLLALMKNFGCVLLKLFYLGKSMLLATAILQACMIRMLHLFS